MAPQVFITTTTSQAGVDAGVALEKELRDVGMTIVNREARDPAQISESKVSCYSADTCKDAKDACPPFARQRLCGRRGGCLQPGGRQFRRHGGDACITPR